MEYSCQDFRASQQHGGFFVDSFGSLFLFPTPQKKHYFYGIMIHIWEPIHLWWIVSYYDRVRFIGYLLSLLFMNVLHFVFWQALRIKLVKEINNVMNILSGIVGYVFMMYDVFKLWVQSFFKGVAILWSHNMLLMLYLSYIY